MACTHPRLSNRSRRQIQQLVPVLLDLREQLCHTNLRPVASDHRQNVPQHIRLGDRAVNVRDHHLVAVLPAEQVALAARRALVRGRHTERDLVHTVLKVQALDLLGRQTQRLAVHLTGVRILRHVLALVELAVFRFAQRHARHLLADARCGHLHAGRRRRRAVRSGRYLGLVSSRHANGAGVSVLLVAAAARLGVLAVVRLLRALVGGRSAAGATPRPP